MSVWWIFFENIQQRGLRAWKYSKGFVFLNFVVEKCLLLFQRSIKRSAATMSVDEKRCHAEKPKDWQTQD